jgi:hypothetical protein
MEITTDSGVYSKHRAFAPGKARLRESTRQPEQKDSRQLPGGRKKGEAAYLPVLLVDLVLEPTNLFRRYESQNACGGKAGRSATEL